MKCRQMSIRCLVLPYRDRGLLSRAHSCVPARLGRIVGKYDATAARLARDLAKNFEDFVDSAPAAVRAAGPASQ